MKTYEYGKDYAAFDKELIEKLYSCRIYGVPFSMYILDQRKTRTYCHTSSDILAYFIEGAVVVEGDMPGIKADDKRHSWVEKGDIVYEVTKGVMWDRESFYDRYKPFNCIVSTRDEIQERVKKSVESKDNLNEVYYVWMRDLEDHADELIYGEFLKEHVDRFRKEKDLDNKKLNPKLIEELEEDLKRRYQVVEDYLATDDTVKK